MKTSIIAAVALIVGVLNANAGRNIYITCSNGRVEQKTQFKDGSVQTEHKTQPMSFSMDIDLDKNTINGEYHSIGNAPFFNSNAFHADAEFLPYAYAYLAIDRLGGTAMSIDTFYPPSGGCPDKPGNPCVKTEITTVYQCVPAKPKF